MRSRNGRIRLSGRVDGYAVKLGKLSSTIFVSYKLTNSRHCFAHAKSRAVTISKSLLYSGFTNIWSDCDDCRKWERRWRRRFGFFVSSIAELARSVGHNNVFTVQKRLPGRSTKTSFLSCLWIELKVETLLVYIPMSKFSKTVQSLQWIRDNCISRWFPSSFCRLVAIRSQIHQLYRIRCFSFLVQTQ